MLDVGHDVHRCFVMLIQLMIENQANPNNPIQIKLQLHSYIVQHVRFRNYLSTKQNTNPTNPPKSHYLSAAAAADTQPDAMALAAFVAPRARAPANPVADSPRTASTASRSVDSCTPDRARAASPSAWPAYRCPCTLGTCTDRDR